MTENNDLEKKTTTIHTLESDLASAVRDENYGKNIIKIVTNPDNNTVVQSPNPNRGGGFKIGSLFSKRNILFFFIAIVLIGAGGAMLYILEKAKNVGVEDNLPDVVATTTDDTANNPIIRSSDILNPEVIQSSDFANLNRSEIITELGKIKDLLVTKKIEPGNNVGIGTNLTITQFFEKLRYSGNEAFLRSLGTVYAFGLYSVKDNNFETYLLIEVTNFDLAFKSILEWEKYMTVDLKDVFIGNNQIPTLAATIATSTSTSTATTTIRVATSTVKYYKKNTLGFVDRVLKNYDIREYVKNEDNETILYGFINNKYLLITSGESSFVDIKDRLLKENIIR